MDIVFLYVRLWWSRAVTDLTQWYRWRRLQYLMWKYDRFYEAYWKEHKDD